MEEEEQKNQEQEEQEAGPNKKNSLKEGAAQRVQWICQLPALYVLYFGHFAEPHGRRRASDIVLIEHFLLQQPVCYVWSSLVQTLKNTAK